MTTFAQAVNAPSMTQTTNGMEAYDSTGDKLVNLFFNIGSSRNNPAVVHDFITAFGHNKLLAMKALFWARDIRGGAGERNTFRSILQTLELVDPSAVLKNLHLVAEYGRWDDLLVLHVPAIRRQALKLFADAIVAGNGLACKWAPRKGIDAVALTKTLKMTPKQYRKTIVAGSNTVEQKMCAQQWTDIEYGKLPSVASARYQSAFMKHDEAGYNEYKEALKSGAAKVNANAIFPHDVLRAFKTGKGDVAVADAQWNALPNYIGDRKIMPISDVSGSMGVRASGSVSCMDVSIALGLYLASKNTGVFKDLILTFDDTPILFQVEGDLAAKYAQLANAPWGGSTNFQASFDLILRKAIENNVPQEEMPEAIVCLSDMQFNEADCSRWNRSEFNATAIEMIRLQYEQAGYKMPVLVFWNLNAQYGNFPSTSTENGIVMISGFSPAIMKSVLAFDFDEVNKITPMSVMLETLNSSRYEAVTV